MPHILIETDTLDGVPCFRVELSHGSLFKRGYCDSLVECQEKITQWLLEKPVIVPKYSPHLHARFHWMNNG